MSRAAPAPNPSALHCRPPLLSWRPGIDIAVLASGSGTNLQALLDASDIRPHIRLVLSDNEEARALQRAEAVEIATAVVRWGDFPDRSSFSSAVADVVEESGAKGVVLAGFMRILAPSFIDRFPNRILNIHPSLLPAFPGVQAVGAALERGVKVTGVTIHFIDEKVDHGPIVSQRSVEVRPDDTVESLHRRIQDVEHRLYPRVVRAFLGGRLAVVEGRVVWS